jgi:hypothetical protein
MTFDPGDAPDVSGDSLLTLWKVGRVGLPRIARVYRDALAGLAPADHPDGLGGEVVPLWMKVRAEFAFILTLCADRIEATGEAVRRAIAGYTGSDADGADPATAAGRELWRRIHDPLEVDPADPEQNPPAVAEVPTAAPGAPADTDHLAGLTARAEALHRLAVEKKKADEKAYGEWVQARFADYEQKVERSYRDWYTTHEDLIKSGSVTDADELRPPAYHKELRGEGTTTAELKTAYDKHVEESCAWIVPAFREWAAVDPDALTAHVAAIGRTEARLGDGEVLRLANGAQLDLAAQWTGSYCANLRNFLGALLIVPGNQQAVARTLRELLEAEQALWRQAQGNIVALADKACEAIEAIEDDSKPETRTYLTILSAVAWIAGAALAIPSGGVSIYAGVVTFNAIAAVSGAAAGMLPSGSPRSLSADSVDGVLENVTRVLAEARSDLAKREQDVVSALRHNHEALSRLRRPAQDATINSPVTPAQPTIVNAKPGQLRGGLHPR